VCDLLAALAETLSDLYKRRDDALGAFTQELAMALPRAQLAKLHKLWTPLSALEGNKAAQQASDEARKALGYWAGQTLALEDAPGKLDGAQWRWLLWQRLPDLSQRQRDSAADAFERQQPLLSSLEPRINAIEALIERIIYRLYGLTEQEIAVVEGKATE
jgi:hypothetical protein